MRAASSSARRWPIHVHATALPLASPIRTTQVEGPFTLGTRPFLRTAGKPSDVSTPARGLPFGRPFGAGRLRPSGSTASWSPKEEPQMAHLIDRCDIIDMLEESATTGRLVVVQTSGGRRFTDRVRDVVTEAGEDFVDF